MKNRDKGTRGPRSGKPSFRNNDRKEGFRGRDEGRDRKDFSRDRPREDRPSSRDRFPARSTTRRPREDRNEGSDRKPFRSRDDRPRDDFKKRDDFKPRRDRDDRPRRDFGDKKPFRRDEGGEGKPFRSREDRPRRDRDDRPRKDFGDRKPFRRDESGEGKPFRSREDRPRRDRDDGFKKPYYKRDFDREPREPAKPKLHATLWGVHAVQEAWLNPARKIKTFYATEHALKAFLEVYEKAKELGLKRPMPEVISKEEFDRSFPTAVHQGLALDAEALEETFLQDLINEASTRAKTALVVLDQVTDPHNVGAIMRSASAFGASGMVMQDRNAPEVTPVLAKSACGAVEHMPVAFETNLGRALAQLREAGFFVIGLDEHSESTFADYTGRDKIVLVLGAEGKGMRPGLREHCDALVTLPTQGAIRSLNVSNAAAVALYALKTAS